MTPNAPSTSNSDSTATSDTSNPPDSSFNWRPARPAAASSSPSRSPSPPKPPPLDISNYPTGEKSLSGISLRAFFLGTAFGLFTSLTIFLTTQPLFPASASPTTTPPTPLWRIPFFISSLALFHFLEYWVTAQYNVPFANISAFLLSSNGWAYNAAHGSAILECLISHIFFPNPWFRDPIPGLKLQVVIGLLLMALGQVVRTVAMAQAGTNFNHTVQVERREGHRLVRNGVYAVLRHPSYFGFFWWGLGTQLVLGNVVCLAGYAAVLWRFFAGRIYREERFLLAFFGDEYEEYRKETRVGIPGIP